MKAVDNEVKIIDAGAKYTLFLRIKGLNVNKTSDSIYEYIKDTKKPLCRYVQRFVPVLNTCKAYLDDIDKCVEATFNKYYNANETIKYNCMYKSSNNCVIKRDDIIKSVNKYFQNKNQSNKVDYDNPDYVVLVQCIRNMCFISFLKDFVNYRKYNLVEMGIKFSSNEEKKIIEGIQNANKDVATSSTDVNEEKKPTITVNTSTNETN